MTASNDTLKKINPSQRGILYLASVLVLIMGSILFLLAEETETYFAWTIGIPLTAAFLGGSFLSSFILEFFAARESLWARGRVAMPSALAFTAATTFISFLHLDKFHLNATNPITLIITWAWILVYLLVPFAFVFIFIRQLTTKGTEPTRLAPLPVWYKIGMAIQGIIMIGLGLGLIFSPNIFAGFWLWDLTALTAGAVGAWLLGLGVAALHSVIENDWSRLRPAIFSYLAFAILQSINLLRYPDAAGLDWSQAKAWLYLAFLLIIFLFSAYGAWMSLRHHHAD